MDYLTGLNPAQLEAVQTVAGPLLILAGPGSGKTRVITHRIAYLIDNDQVSAHNILAVTFTNKAAREMIERLRNLLPDRVGHLTIGTFHAVCARILRRDGQSIGLPSTFAIYDDEDQMQAVRRSLRELNLDERQYSPRAILSSISSAKSRLLDPLQYGEHITSYWEEVVLRVYRAYQERLAECSAQDFDDLLLTTVRLFQERPDILQRYQNRYVHVLVDEFQDTNVCQYALVKLFSGKHRNVCVVGDPDQSIYGWRNADIRNILSFERDFPNCRTIGLEQNYRSTRVILDAATAVVSHNRLRKNQSLWTENSAGQPVVVCRTHDDEEEAGWVAAQIEGLCARGGIRLRDCAVMYRTNAQSRVLERVFVRRSLPHKVVGTRFYQRREIKDVIAYLRVIHNPDDSGSLMRIINLPPRGLGAKTVSELARWARLQDVSVYRALLRFAQSDGDDTSSIEHPFTSRASQNLRRFLQLMEELRAASSRCGLVELLGLVVESTGYRDHLLDGSQEGDDRWDNVRGLIGDAEAYESLAPPSGLAALLEDAALATDVDEYDETDNAVTLITLHAAKGLEFAVVFIVGVEEGICPHARSIDDPHQMEEERRLFYVGMTRACRQLYLTHAARRSYLGGSTSNEPSRFITDIPKELIHSSSGLSRRAGSALVSADLPRHPRPWRGQPRRNFHHELASAPLAAAKTAGPRFKTGDRVFHSKFGEGIVVTSTLVLGDEEVEVAFAGIGVKKLSTTFACLEVR